MLSKVCKISSILLLGFVAFFAVGCGDSDDGFVFNGNNSGSTGVGSELVFRFQRPVTAQTTVPTDTTTVRFDLYSTESPAPTSLISTESRLYADLIVLQNVSTETRSVRVSLLGAGGVPIGTYTKTVSVPAGSRIEVPLDGVEFAASSLTGLAVNPDPVAMYITAGDPSSSILQLTATATIDGAQYEVPFKDVSVTAEHTNVVDILEGGSLIAKINPLFLEIPSEEFRPRLNTTLTASYTLNQTTRQTTVPVRLHYFFSYIGYYASLVGISEFPVPRGVELDLFTTDSPELFFYIGPDGQVQEIPLEDVSISLDSPTDKISYNPETGVLSIAADASLGTKFSIQWTWVDGRENGSNHTYVERFNLVVAEEDDT